MDIKGNDYNEASFKNFDAFVLQLQKDGINWKKLKGVDRKHFWFIMDDIKVYISQSLKSLGWSYKDYKEECARYYDEYKIVELDTNKQQLTIKLTKGDI